jgi:hypothetical protein
MDGPELEPLPEDRPVDEKLPRPPAWPYGLLIFLVTPLLVGGVGYFFPSAGCGFAGLVYLVELIGGLVLREGHDDRLGRSLIFAVVATCGVVALGVLILAGVCLVGGGGSRGSGFN